MTRSRLSATSLLLLSSTLFAAGCVAGVWVPLGPPGDQVEVQGLVPGPGYVWIDGYWAWHDRWMWQPGRWARPPHPGARWERGRWDHDRRGWRWREGRWH